ncbi:cytochrome C biogenesis protein [Lysobacteraceae bacterium NML08-0793]|nr:cytochrome C biogenesis protein [Xanthomonadaceae bacterium NML08-0793]
MSVLSRVFLFFAIAISSLASHAQTAGSDELPPVDSVFKLTASAPSRELIEVRWQIAPGYYLYRHRTQVEPLGGFAAGALQIPPGQKHHDEFFGDVETYRGELKVALPGSASADGIALRIKYQGCADIGICYPPQTRTVNVRLPAAKAAAATADAGFAALGQRLGGSAGNSLNLLGSDKAQPLPPEQAFRMETITDGSQRLLLRATPARGYYLYRDKISLRLENAAGIRLGKPAFPAARDHHDEHFGQVKVYFDEAEIPIPLTRSGAGVQAQEVTLHIGWQGCQENGICYEPMRKSFRLNLPLANAADIPETATTPAAPTDSNALVTPVSADDPPAPDTNTNPDSAPHAPGVEALASPPPPADNTAAQGSQHHPIGLIAALLLALAGGLILNLMPCVLPVLSLKALALAQSGESPAHARRHAIWYTLGVLSSFAVLGGIVLALRQQWLADGISWGFQLQTPWVVATLALLVFAFGLSLSGLWYAQLAAPRVGVALSQKSGHTGDFFTGVLAVVLATPCTAPFMGAALAYAFLAPAAAAMLVFLGLGLGLALPFLLIGFIPQLGRRLPKPGAWMETLKQLLAFPMYATSAWLVWVLVQQRGADAFGLWALAAISLTLTLWAWTRVRSQGQRWLLALAIPALLASLWAVHGIHRLPTPQNETAEADSTRVSYSPERLARLRSEGRAVFVNITADWCVTCKANERAVFSRDDFQNTLTETGVVYMVGDHTDVDPQISAFLREHGAVGLPLYVVYPASGAAPQILPVVMTPAIARQALLDAVQ